MFEIEWFDLSRFIKAFGYDDFTADVVADYLVECTCELNLTQYMWNTLPYFVQVFKTKAEALNYIDEEGLDKEECTIYECDNKGGVYLEHD